jgi:lupus La protein
MWGLHTKNESHYVPISIVASFKRMREYLPMGLPWLVTALRESTALEVDEAGENVRRRTEVQPPKDVFERSVYAKGFGADEKDGELQKELETYFTKWGTVNAVRLRRDNNKKFKVLVKFSIPLPGYFPVFVLGRARFSWNTQTSSLSPVS